LYFVFHSMSPVLRLCSVSPFICPLSHVSVLCLLSVVPSLASLFLGFSSSIPSRLCSLSPVLCTLSHVTCSLSPFLLSPSPISCPSVPYLWLYFIVPVLCSSGSRPLFLRLLSSVPPTLVPCLSYLRECEFFFKIQYTCMDRWRYII
jgi:hypothetical protein